MTNPFNPYSGLVTVRADIIGETGKRIIRLAIDTGATRTAISADLLQSLGCKLTSGMSAEVITGSRRETIQFTQLKSISVLGVRIEAFPVLAHNLPDGINVDGLLGLDFFRQRKLSLDFINGLVELN